MSEIVIHGVPGSPFVRSVQMGLLEKSVGHRLQAMEPHESKSDRHLKRHPFGRVPAIEHGEFCLYETQAILRYLDDVFPEPSLEPDDPCAAARMNQIVGINDCYFFPKVTAVIVFHRIIAPVLLGTPADETAVAAAVPMGRTCIGEFDRLLGVQPFLAGDRLSLADILLAPQIDFFAVTPEGKAMLEGTRLQDWLQRMNARPSMLSTQRPEALRSAA